jgi:TRAP-type C4-dicarboxylate transport system permease small subunit
MNRRRHPEPRGRRRISASLTSAVLLAVALLFAPVAAWACPVCFGSTPTPITKGASNGILFLLGIIGFVQICFAALFVTWWLRARELRRRRESFRLIDGGVQG